MTADLDRDGDIDVAIASLWTDSVGLHWNDGSGGLTAGPTLPTGERPISLVAADFDDDGWIDLAVAAYSAGEVTLFENRGQGNFAAAVAHPRLHLPKVLAAGDVDGDGALDLVVGHGLDTFTVLRGSGLGSFVPDGTYVFGYGTYALTLGDLDLDGDPDVIGFAWAWVVTHRNLRR